MSRRKDREFVEVPEPRFSVILSGTPRQVQRLIPDEEDGLLSRFIYYFIPFRRGIRNVFSTDSISNSKHVAFKKLGERFITMYNQFMQLGIVEIVVPRYHVLLFCAWLTNLNEESCDSIDNGMQGLVRRLGLIAYRIMMIFTVIRAMSESIPTIISPNGNIVLECTEEDFFSALCICETLLYHSAFIYVKLSSHGSQKHCLFPNQESKLDVTVSSTICPILLIEPPMIESLRKGTKMQVLSLSGLISSLRMADLEERNKVDT